MRYKKLLPWMVTKRFEASYLIGSAAKDENIRKLNLIAERHRKSDLHTVTEEPYFKYNLHGEKLLFKKLIIERVA